MLPGVSGYVRKRKEELGFEADTDDNTCCSESESYGDTGSVDACAVPPREPEEGPALATECHGESGTLDAGEATSAIASEARRAREKQRGERAAATVKLWHSCKEGDAAAAAAALAQGAEVSNADEVCACAYAFRPSRMRLSHRPLAPPFPPTLPGGEVDSDALCGSQRQRCMHPTPHQAWCRSTTP